MSVNRLEAVLGGPSTATYGFPDTCKDVIPPAKITRAHMKKANEGTLAAGRNNSAPALIVNRPMTIVR